MFTSHQRSNKKRENEKRRHKAGIEGGGTEREDTRMQTEVVWTREENGREQVCQVVSGAQGTRNKEERTPEKAMDGLCWDDGRVVDLDKVDDRIEW